MLLLQVARPDEKQLRVKFKKSNNTSPDKNGFKIRYIVNNCTLIGAVSYNQESIIY